MKDRIRQGAALGAAALVWALAGCSSAEPTTTAPPAAPAQAPAAAPAPWAAPGGAAPGAAAAPWGAAAAPAAGGWGGAAPGEAVPGAGAPVSPIGPLAPIPVVEDRPDMVYRDPDSGRVQAIDEEARRLLSQAGKDLVEQREREERLIALYLEHANAQRAQGNYLEALRDCERILEIRPLHPQASRLRDEIRAHVGDVEGSIRSLTDTLHGEYIVMVERAQAEAQAEYAKGTAAYEEGRFDDAIRHFERTVEIIEFAPGELDLSVMKRNAEAAVADAHQKRQQKLREQDQVARRVAERIAMIERRRRLQQRKKEIYDLLLQAQRNFSVKRYAQAKENLQRVLSLDPMNNRARTMLKTVGQAENTNASQEYVTQRVEQWRVQIQEWEESQIPYLPDAHVRFPDSSYWERVSQRQYLENQATERIEDPEVRQIKNVLETKVISSLEFTETPFKDVIEFLADNGGINIVLDKNVLDKGSDPITFTVSNLKLGDALDLLLSLMDLDKEFKNGVLFIRGKGEVSADAVLKVHDIRDITRSIENFTAPVLELPDDSGGAVGAMPSFIEGGDEGGVIDVEQIKGLIQESIAPQSWGNAPFALTETPDNQLLVYHTPDVQDQVAALLNSLRKNAGLLVAVETRFITIRDDYLEAFGIDFRGLGGVRGTLAPLEDIATGSFGGGLFDNGSNGAPTTPPAAGFFFNDRSDGDLRARSELVFDNPLGDILTDRGGLAVQFVYLDDSEVNMILRAVKKSRTATLLTAPRLVAYNTQRANIAVVDQIAYIRDFTVELAQGVAVADPVVATVPDGLVLEVTPTVSHDRKYVTLELRPTISQLIRPIPTFTTNLGNLGGQSVTIQIPEIMHRRAETTVKVPDGGSVLIGGLKRVRDVNLVAEVPWLAQLPIIGNLFKRHARAVERENLIIVVTARIVDLNTEERKQTGR